MLFRPSYDAPAGGVESLIRETPVARLITVDSDGRPHLGIFPFIAGDGWFELHLARGDEQLDHLRAHPNVLIEVDEIFGPIKSHWVGREATHADMYYRAALFDVDAQLFASTDAVASHLEKLVARYQPEGGYDPIKSTPGYREYFAYLTVVHLTVTRARSKFKLGQGGAAESLAAIHSKLLERGSERDVAAVQAARETASRNH
jgi:predicted FMN-binding regulatory protein PaiB